MEKELDKRKQFWGSIQYNGAALGDKLNGDPIKLLKLKTMKRISHFVWLRKQFYQVHNLKCNEISFYVLCSLSCFSGYATWKKERHCWWHFTKWKKNNSWHLRVECWVWEGIEKSELFSELVYEKNKKMYFHSLSYDSFNLLLSFTFPFFSTPPSFLFLFFFWVLKSEILKLIFISELRHSRNALKLYAKFVFACVQCFPQGQQK